jgi:hypothetical protein
MANARKILVLGLKAHNSVYLFKIFEIMKIKSAIFCLSFLFISSFSFGQDMFNVKNQAQNSLKVLQEQLTKVAPDLTLTDNQIVKLEKVFLKSNKEKEDLIKSSAHKSQYAADAKAIDDKYAPTIASILTEKQRVAFEKVRSMAPKGE